MPKIGERMGAFTKSYSHHFQVHRWNNTKHAEHYLAGLTGLKQRKNMEAIEADVAECSYQGIQNFISDSPWDHVGVMKQVASDVAGVFIDNPDTALYIDETSFQKKGNSSVGVQRQYCGRLGKIENCQVGVFAVLGAGSMTGLVDFRLFLPAAWAKDKRRCDKAKIPIAHRVHRSKNALALEMIVSIKAAGLKFNWVGGDAAYGTSRELTDALDDLGIPFVMDVSSTVSVAPSDITNNCDHKAISVSKLTESRFAKEATTIDIRSSTQGVLRKQVFLCRVVLPERSDSPGRERMLIVSKEEDGKFKYSLSNILSSCSIERYAFMQSQRFWIEAAFHDSKSELGMADYEVRSWVAWHHHMALVCMAHTFVLKEKCTQVGLSPLISTRDVVEMLAYYLPRRNLDANELTRRLENRHAKRQRDIDNRVKRQAFYKVIPSE